MRSHTLLTESQLEQIRQFAEEVAIREGCLLYDLEFREGPGRLLRVFIDKDAGGVSVNDCVNVSRGLNLRLDVKTSSRAALTNWKCPPLGLIAS
ncbi:MAG: hypothetical protein HC883_05055 [Bdellovibrionaceae bacterium]|nr:hypothetical protein [Pseudobdellovibrionaceae bacterium]